MMDSDQVAGLPMVFTYSDARRHGLSERFIYRLRDSGAVEPLGRGLFRRHDAGGDPDLVEVAARTKAATLCLTSAFARHGLTDEIPAVLDVAIPRGSRAPAVSAPVKWRRFDPDTFSIGRDLMPVGALEIGIYGPERSICDAFRLAHLEGFDQAVNALKAWLTWPESHPAELLKMARNFGNRAETPIREALQVLL